MTDVAKLAAEREALHAAGWERAPAFDRRKGWGQGVNREAWRNRSIGEIRLLDLETQERSASEPAGDQRAAREWR
jgi:hypothetical protein